MSRKTMKTLLHLTLLLLLALVGVFFFAFLPFYGQEIVRCDAEFAWAYVPCLVWAWAFAVPILAAFVPAWRIVSTIAIKGHAFTSENANRLKLLSLLSCACGILFPVGMLAVANMGAGSAVLTLVITPLVVFACAAVALVFYVLHRLVFEASTLREENDLTI